MTFAFKSRRQPLIDKAARAKLQADLARRWSPHPGDTSTPPANYRARGTPSQGDGGPAVEYSGYCVSSIDTAGAGEIDSLCVHSEHPDRGIGGTLIRRALGWLDDEHVQTRTRVAVWGNPQVLPFYRRYGFGHRAVTLRPR
ncbi:MAG: GNAT family N-acetyltransferase [Phycisphaerae bacterium]|nr:GNAT family N-acetyltransferase [Phycisphaerae bacterium]